MMDKALRSLGASFQEFLTTLDGVLDVLQGQKEDKQVRQCYTFTTSDSIKYSNSHFITYYVRRKRMYKIAHNYTYKTKENLDPPPNLAQHKNQSLTITKSESVHIFLYAPKGGLVMYNTDLYNKVLTFLLVFFYLQKL